MNPQIQTMLQQAMQDFQLGYLKKAEEVLSHCAQVDPKIFDVLHLLAIVYASQEKHRPAIECYKKALELNPNDESALSNLGSSLNAIGHNQEALSVFQKALKIDPNAPIAWYNAANILCDTGEYKEALTYYERSIKLNPQYYQAYINYGKVLFELKRYSESLTSYDKALRIDQNSLECLINKGATLKELALYEEAIAHYDKALSLKPDYHEAWSNKGVTLHELKRYDEAITHYDKALSLKPDYHEASWNKSLCLLLQGNFENGLQLYESRWNSKIVSEEIGGKRLFDKPTWLGVEPLQDKTILLYGEQGLGDFIQFCRYVKLVADLGAKVILEVPKTLEELMQGLEGVSELVIRGNKLPFFDYQCSLLSLPLAFKTNLDNIPNQGGYINLDGYSNKIKEWKLRLSSKIRPRVGLVWSGNLHHKNDHNRSILLSDILPSLPNQFEYVSLQKELREVDKLTLDSNLHILNFSSHLNDFLDTAALIDNLDLVISVDTSVAHLSGALGKKTLLLLPYVPDWRWLLDREDSPWYPSMKLYRQTSMGNWSGALERVKSDLSSH
jgi:tetratricopeptide (TPR) repeat protein